MSKSDNSEKKVSKQADGDNVQTKQSRDKKTKEVAQLSFLIYILNKDFSFQMNRPRKKSTVNCAFPDLVEINFGQDKTNIVEFLNERTKKDSERFMKTLTPKQANRKLDNMKRIILNNYLTDLVTHRGVKIESKTTHKDVEQMERFVRIDYDGHIYNQLDIIETGIEINTILMKLLDKHPSIVVEKGKLYELYK